MKVLVANRGEIAIRIMRACREMGFASVAVYSECDRGAPHVIYAAEAYAIGASEPQESYLCADKMLEVAERADVWAVHPGYGFLSENGEFAASVRAAGRVFVGPSADAIALMGGKVAARETAVAAGVSVVPGTGAPVDPAISHDAMIALASTIGYPLLVKAVAGGGGKGMRLVSEPSAIATASTAARSEARSAFGDDAVYLERQLQSPRHIEIQILADEYGTVVPFVERECSIQRRYHKLVEESPAFGMSLQRRTAMADAAVSIAKAVGYTNAGTVEFLVDESDAFYFLEMNTRLQVEHGVTEAVTGIDLVRWQLRIAQGEKLDISPELTLTPAGHAIECRIYAEDPDAAFLPSPGRIRGLQVPSGPGIREDSCAVVGGEVPVFYDPLISKVVAWGADRTHAIARMRRAMDEFRVQGIKTTVPFFQWLIRSGAFATGTIDTTFVDTTLVERDGQPFAEPSSEAEEVAVIGVAVHAFLESAWRERTENQETSSPWRQAARAAALRN